MFIVCSTIFYNIPFNHCVCVTCNHTYKIWTYYGVYAIMTCEYDTCRSQYGRINSMDGTVVLLCCDPGTLVPSIYIIAVPDHGQHPNMNRERGRGSCSRKHNKPRTIASGTYYCLKIKPNLNIYIYIYIVQF